MSENLKNPKQFRPHWNEPLQHLISQFREFSEPIQVQCLSNLLNTMKESNEVVVDETKNKRTITSKKSNRIKTLDDLIEACEIDTEVWEIERYIVNKWEVGSTIEGRVIVEPLFQIKAWLRKNNDIFTLKKLKTM